MAVYDLMLFMRQRHNIEPVVLVKSKNSALTQACREQGIQLISGWTISGRISGRSFLKRLGVAAKNLVKFILLKTKIIPELRRQHAAAPFDLVHSNTASEFTGWYIARCLGIPHVWHFRDHGFGIDYDLHFAFPDSIVRSACAQTAAVVTVSRSIYELYVNKMKLCRPENTRVIHNGVKISQDFTKPRHSDGIVHFCIVGKVADLKNQMMAVRACAELMRTTDKFTLHIIGNVTQEEYYDELVRVIHAEGLDEHVKFWGWRDDVAELLKTMDVGLMLSKSEGFGRVTVECMANYMPVIGVNAGGTTEIILDGETGYIIPLDDTDRLAQVMLGFIEHPEQVQIMGTKGREHAVQNFSLERHTDKIYSLYREILGKSC